MGPTLAVLPVKRFEQAKQRLGGTFSPDQHLQLVEAMIADVLDALGQVDGLDGTIVVTAEPRARALAEAAGADVLDEDGDDGHSAAAVQGAAHAERRGAARVLCVAGDCPAIDPAEVEELLADPHAAPRVILVPDRHHVGTNALLLSPPRVIEPSFGPASRYRHELRSREAGARYSARFPGSLELDIDTRRDLVALQVWLDAHPAAAPRTRALLADHHIELPGASADGARRSGDAGEATGAAGTGDLADAPAPRADAAP
jgi:2-phospho-L-lactate guanylyltransferase